MKMNNYLNYIYIKQNKNNQNQMSDEINDEYSLIGND